MPASRASVQVTYPMVDKDRLLLSVGWSFHFSRLPSSPFNLFLEAWFELFESNLTTDADGQQKCKRTSSTHRQRSVSAEKALWNHREIAVRAVEAPQERKQSPARTPQERIKMP